MRDEEKAEANLDDIQDIDPVETAEWFAALESVTRVQGVERAQQLLAQLSQKIGFAPTNNAVHSAYVNTLCADSTHAYPGQVELEQQIEAWLRWNAMIMVLRAGKVSSELGGHIASYASSAVLYEVGFQHFWHAASKDHLGDLIFYQGHSSPGIYARSFLEGRLSEEKLDHFRQEIGQPGLSSYPHPWLMGDYWQFPTVSMGLGPIQAIYQARFLAYLENRQLLTAHDRKVWCFCGDGEMDEPESVGALSIAAREKLGHLIFVINCNLQRLDGPVRGNGKIVQELEGIFRGAGWRVIKVLWGQDWDPLFATEHGQLLAQVLEDLVDGAFQSMIAQGGAGIRATLCHKQPLLKELLAAYSDQQLESLLLGGHCRYKVHAAYHAACQDSQQPTVILAKTIKGFGMGKQGQAQNITHQLKKMDQQAVQAYRDRLQIPFTDNELEQLPFFQPKANDPALSYLHQQRKKLGGYLPSRRRQSKQAIEEIPLKFFASLLKDSGQRSISTTMVFVRLINLLLKHPELGQRVVPIIPDEARTFGMEGMFRQYGIYSPAGQLYDPVDHQQIMSYKESISGQVLEEGINEAGSFCSWIAAATSYSNHDLALIPFYIFYSMFGFQRIGDLAWAAGDCQARGFLLGGTAGRTTLAGEGLQHQDGHSLLNAATIPNCISYDPTFGYEVAVIIQDGLRRMLTEQENVFYYLTLMNENYHQPAMPEGAETGILRGIYPLSQPSDAEIVLLGSGTILREVQAAANMLLQDYSLNCEVYSVTSFNELGRDGQNCTRANALNPENDEQIPFVSQVLSHCKDKIVIAATDYMRLYAEQIRAYVPAEYFVLGTDGFGRSDTRKALRHHFEVDAQSITFFALSVLYKKGKLSKKKLIQARCQLQIEPKRLPAWQL